MAEKMSRTFREKQEVETMIVSMVREEIENDKKEQGQNTMEFKLNEIMKQLQTRKNELTEGKESLHHLYQSKDIIQHKALTL